MVIRVLLLFVVLGVLNPARAHELPTIEDLARLRDLGALNAGLALSPDGRWLATFRATPYPERNQVQYDLLLIPADGRSEVRVVGDGGGYILHDDSDGRRTGGFVERFPRWSPDGRWIAYLAERDGRVELWRSDVRGRSRRVQSFDGDVRDFAWLSPHHLVAHLATPRRELARQRNEVIAYGFRVSDRFSPAFSLLPNPDVEGASRNLVVDIRSGRMTEATEIEAGALSARVASSARIGARDPSSAAASPPVGLFVRQPNGVETLCDLPECRGRLRESGVLGNGHAWFTRLEGFADADQGIYVWSVAANSIQLLRRGDERFSGCSAGVATLYCFQDYATQPRRVIAINVATGATSVRYDPNPEWSRFSLPRIDRLQFRDAEHLESHAHLVFPSDYVEGRPYPMVIVQYRSRGFLRGGTGGEYPIFPLAARGYFVLSVGRPDPTQRSSETPREQLEHELYVGDEEERMKLDSLDGLIEQTVARGLVDPNRIAITGMSDGAETLFWMLRRRHFAAAVASSPPIDPSSFTMAEAEIRDRMQRLGINGPWPRETDAWWSHNAALYFADQIRTPLLMNLPDSEALHGMPLHVRLAELRVPVETYIYPGLYHIKWRPSALLEAQRRSLAWIDFWLQGQEHVDGRDRSRIERWRRLRDGRAN